MFVTDRHWDWCYTQSGSQNSDLVDIVKRSCLSLRLVNYKFTTEFFIEHRPKVSNERENDPRHVLQNLFNGNLHLGIWPYKPLTP